MRKGAQFIGFLKAREYVFGGRSIMSKHPARLPGTKYPRLVSDCLVHKPGLTGGNFLHVEVKIHGRKPHHLYFTRDHLNMATHELYKYIDDLLRDVGRYLSHVVHGIVDAIPQPRQALA